MGGMATKDAIQVERLKIDDEIQKTNMFAFELNARDIIHDLVQPIMNGNMESKIQTNEYKC